jgi:hypothetical protein
MYSYINYLPLPAQMVQQILCTISNLQYDRLYGIEPSMVINADAQRVVNQCAKRYIQWLHGKALPTTKPPTHVNCEPTAGSLHSP